MTQPNPSDDETDSTENQPARTVQTRRKTMAGAAVALATLPLASSDGWDWWPFGDDEDEAAGDLEVQDGGETISDTVGTINFANALAVTESDAEGLVEVDADVSSGDGGGDSGGDTDDGGDTGGDTGIDRWSVEDGVETITLPGDGTGSHTFELGGKRVATMDMQGDPLGNDFQITLPNLSSETQYERFELFFALTDGGSLSFDMDGEELGVTPGEFVAADESGLDTLGHMVAVFEFRFTGATGWVVSSDIVMEQAPQ